MITGNIIGADRFLRAPMAYSDYIIYVDESGDHSLTTIDRDYPIFSLSFCIFQKSQYYHEVCPAVQQFKFKYFGHDAVVLHEHEIRKQKPPFVFLQNQARRIEFMEDLNALMDGIPMTIVAATIHKEVLRTKYSRPHNPYDLALRFCMERAYAFLRDARQMGRITHIVVECRGRREDADLELSFRRIAGGDNEWGKMAEFDLVLAAKSTNSAGLQLADLTARPIGRRRLSPAQPNRAWDIIVRKLRRSPVGSVSGWGLKDFP